jgi:elongation factor P
MYQTSDIKNGLKLEIDGQPWTVTWFQFVKPGKGTAFTRTKIKNLITGQVRDITYRSGEKLKPANMAERRMSFLYQDGEDYNFMDTQSYEQVAISKDVIQDEVQYLIEQMEVDVLFFQERPVTMRVPNHVALKITFCEPGVKGDTSSGATKPATLETGLIVQVPLFVNDGESIKVDTRTGKYMERAKK